MSVEYRVGDVFEVMAEMPDGSVDLVLTSPPFLALRSYLPTDHPDKTKEIGSEATPAEYVDVLLRLTAEWRRLLTPHGSICIELGDTYSGSGGSGGDYDKDGLREGQPSFRQRSGWHRSGNEEEERYRNLGAVDSGSPNSGHGWPLAKSLTLIPEAYRFALAYGHNPHTGQPSPAGQWRVRNVVRWVRPNPPVGALGDKFRPATSELAIACTSDKRWFDLDAVREPYAESTLQVSEYVYDTYTGDHIPPEVNRLNERRLTHAGAPPLDWWKISPKGYAGAHYAVWPSELCVKPIQAMCPREVCRTCGEPRRRITGEPIYAPSATYRGGVHKTASGATRLQDRRQEASLVKTAPTLGWTDCGHDDYRPGLVLDPFAGTGTTLAVAHGHSRDAIGIDIDERSAELARGRVGPLFLEIT